MLLGNNDQLAELIVRLFENQPNRTAKSLHEEINSKYRKCSLVAVYKELNKLRDQSVVVKARSSYSLSLSWILEMMRYSESLYESYLSSNSTLNFLPKEGEKLVWEFSDLIKMDQFWVHLMFTLFEASEDRNMYEWVPHLWFPLVDYKRDLQYLRAMQAAKNVIYLIVGGDTLLDRLPSLYWDDEVYKVSYAESPFDKERDRYYCLIDNYVITVKVSKKIAAEIDKLFDRITSKSDLDFQDIHSFFSRKTKVKLTLHCDRHKADKLRKRFYNFWNV